MDKETIKNLLFIKKFRTYTPGVQLDGMKVFHCVDCGDKYLFQSSFDYHVNRKCLQITYNCRYCKKSLVFMNRCNLLSHIRSHAFKTATINVSDITIETIKHPISQNNSQKSNENTNIEPPKAKSKKPNPPLACAECKKPLPVGTSSFKERAKHYNLLSDKAYTCPICLFTTPSLCGLEAHHKIHSMQTPCYCPECGKLLLQIDVTYPYNRHKCKGFKQIKATTRVQCTVEGCTPFNPQNFAKHMFKHMKVIVECCFCNNKATEQSNIKHNKSCSLQRKLNPSELHTRSYYSCEVCKFIAKSLKEAEEHARKSPHNCPVVFICLKCKSVFKSSMALNKHHKQSECEQPTSQLEEESTEKKNNDAKLYRVVKKCDQCKRGFTYKCKFDDIKKLPVDCPFGCAMPKKIKCCICKKRISVDWRMIKAHFAICHKEHRCVDVSVKVERFDMKKYLKDMQKRTVCLNKNTSTNINKSLDKNDEVLTHSCKFCNAVFTNKNDLENHCDTVHKDLVVTSNNLSKNQIAVSST